MTFLAAGGIALLLALGVAIGDARGARRHRELLARGSRAEGVVARITLPFHLSRNKPTSEDKRHTVPVVRFRASDGVEYEFNAREAPHRAGAKVEVVYDPALPSDAKLAQRKSELGCAIFLAIISFAAFAWAFFGAAQ